MQSTSLAGFTSLCSDCYTSLPTSSSSNSTGSLIVNTSCLCECIEQGILSQAMFISFEAVYIPPSLCSLLLFYLCAYQSLPLSVISTSPPSISFLSYFGLNGPIHQGVKIPFPCLLHFWMPTLFSLLFWAYYLYALFHFLPLLVLLCAYCFLSIRYLHNFQARHIEKVFDNLYRQ